MYYSLLSAMINFCFSLLDANIKIILYSILSFSQFLLAKTISYRLHSLSPQPPTIWVMVRLFFNLCVFWVSHLQNKANYLNNCFIKRNFNESEKHLPLRSGEFNNLPILHRWLKGLELVEFG